MQSKDLTLNPILVLQFEWVESRERDWNDGNYACNFRIQSFVDFIFYYGLLHKPQHLLNQYYMFCFESNTSNLMMSILLYKRPPYYTKIGTQISKIKQKDYNEVKKTEIYKYTGKKKI